jgi:hypothetical protein
MQTFKSFQTQAGPAAPGFRQISPGLKTQLVVDITDFQKKLYISHLISVRSKNFNLRVWKTVTYFSGGNLFEIINPFVLTASEMPNVINTKDSRKWRNSDDNP